MPAPNCHPAAGGAFCRPGEAAPVYLSGGGERPPGEPGTLPEDCRDAQDQGSGGGQREGEAGRGRGQRRLT